MNLAYTSHNGQFDKGGYPYIAHPLHLAEQMIDEKTTVLALLHDIVEDTKITFEDIANMGFDDDIITALKLLTRTKNTPYFDYINTIKENALAKVVKIADLEHNLEITRISVTTEKDIERAKKYQHALMVLKQV